MNSTARAFPPEAVKEKVNAGQSLVTVNGRAITQGDLEFLFLSRRIPAEQQDKVRSTFLDELIDRRLIEAFLAERRIEADKIELDNQVARIERLIHDAGKQPQQILGEIGYTPETLRNELALVVKWHAYVNQVTTPATLRAYFEQHKNELDGTQIRARQVFLKIADPADEAGRQKALARLKQIRADIAAGTLDFAAAAKMYSESPSGAKGGDVGYFKYRGKMPVSFTRQVFDLDVGEMSEPFTSPFGAHLVQVTERKPGDLSLEDVRPQVVSQVREELWAKTAAELRAKAIIQRSNEKK